MKEILIGILIFTYGFIFYIIGRINLIEAVLVRKLQNFLNDTKESER